MMRALFLILTFNCFFLFAQEPDSAVKRRYIEPTKERTPPQEEEPEAPPPSRGSTAMENGNLKFAYKHFLKELKKDNCDQRALGGLLKLAKLWEHQSSHQRSVIHIYRLIRRCKPDDANIVFLLGRQYAWMGKNVKAKKTLSSVLKMDPRKLEAASMLIKVYIGQGHWKRAKELLNQYPHLEDADQDRAAIAFQSKNYRSAEDEYQKLVDKNSEDLSARRGLARSLSAQRKFRASKNEYANLIRKNSKSYHDWSEYRAVRSHTNIGIYSVGGYTKSKQTDPDIGQPVVVNYYTYGFYGITFPIFDQWKIDLRQLFFHRKQIDIFIPVGTNYNAYIYGAEALSSVFLLKYLQWDVTLRILGARGYNNNVIFPFSSTTRFEPGTSIIYSDPMQNATLNTHVESFIFKNFDVIETQLMRTFYLHADYTFHPNVWLSPELYASFDEVFYQDSINNRRNTENLWARFDLFTSLVKFLYMFEHANFKETTDNYYTFKRQFRNTLGGILRISLGKNLFIEGIYKHRWTYTVGLNQPIGIFNFQADKQRLQSDRIVLRSRYQLRDQLVLEAKGHLFYTSLPYRDYNVQGSISWQF